MRQKYFKQDDSRLFGSSLTLSVFLMLLCLSFPNCNGFPSTKTIEKPTSTPILTPTTTTASTTPVLPPSNVACKRVLPGLRKLSLGVDVTTLDLLPLTFTTKDGFKNPVIDFSCNEEKFQIIDDTSYDVPDQFISVINKPGGILRSEVSIMTKSSDVLKMMSANVGISIAMKGSFSASASYKRLTSNFYNESRNVERIVSHQSTRTAKLRPQFALKLGKYAQMYVDRFLPDSFESGPEKYFKFIKYFGTHYFSKLYFGGTLQFILETNKAYFQGKSARAVKTEVSATFFKFVQVNAGFSSSDQKVDSHFTENTNKLIRYYGGDTNLLAAGGISDWQPSISKNPGNFGGQLVTVSDLIEDKLKRRSMETATQIYIDMAYINSLLDLLNMAFNKHARFYKQISSYISQVKALNASDHNAVDALGNTIEEQLEVPSWFMDDIKLCYKWRADADVGQCSNKATGVFCANVGSMTDYYRDDTDGRNGGCRMQWGVHQPGHVSKSWIQQTQLCLKWCCNVRNDGNCASGASKTICAPVNQFTTEYTDSSDSYRGGCRMQWRLVVPDSAPIWYRSVKLCFEWYTDGDGGQCGGGADKLLCATANSWTSAYQDHTDNRKGGCLMRWGIIPS